MAHQLLTAGPPVVLHSSLLPLALARRRQNSIKMNLQTATPHRAVQRGKPFVHCAIEGSSGYDASRRSLLLASVASSAATLQLRYPPRSSAASSVFEGVYDDPNHPGCPRTIDGTGLIKGVDPVPFQRGAGCGKGTPLSPWTIQGDIDEAKGTIFIDFDQKDGSGEAFVGKWTGKGIKLPDGTVWAKVAVK